MCLVALGDIAVATFIWPSCFLCLVDLDAFMGLVAFSCFILFSNLASEKLLVFLYSLVVLGA